MTKINLDKYYTPVELAEYVVNKTKEIIGEENITEYLEPSAGAGVFLDFLGDNYLAYDIEPEDEEERIVKQDYLELDLEYKKGRCVIGNPPYGKGNVLSVQFYKKSIQLGDYIVFILPISQHNNQQQMYEFDLIHSEIVENKDFIHLDKRIKLCFNVYRRNKAGFNSKPTYKLKSVKIEEYRVNKVNNITSNFDIGMCSFGWAIGREPEYIGQYSKEFYLYVKSEQHKSQVIDLIRNVDWRKEINITGTENINQWQVYKYIKDNIEGIE